MLKYIIFITKKEIKRLTDLEAVCHQHGIKILYELPEETTLIKETLYITDNEEICSLMLEENAMVLVWLHEENKEQNLSKAPYAIENIEDMDLGYAKRIFQRYQGLPWKIAETKRCIIREMKEEDLEAIYEIYASPSITRYMEGLYEDRKEELQYIKSYIQNAYKFWGFGTWVIERKSDRRIIGRVGFNMREGYEEPELGFVIMESMQKNGYAFECCKTILQLSKEEYEFDRVQAFVKEENTASVNLCTKLGFELQEKIKLEEEEYLRFMLKL